MNNQPTLAEIMLNLIEGKADTYSTAAQLFTAYTGKPCTADDMRRAEEETHGTE